MVFAIFLLSGCGSDDDSYSSASSSSSTTSSISSLDTMPANAVEANVSSANVNDMLNTDKTSENSRTSLESDKEKLNNLSMIKNRILSEINDIYIYPSESNNNSSRATISDSYTQNCTTSGTTTGSYSYDTSTYIMNITLAANNCIEENTNENGSFSIKVTYANDQLEDYSELEFKIGSSGYTIASTVNSFSLQMAENSYFKEYNITSYDLAADEPTVYSEKYFFKASADDEVFYEDSIVQHLSSTKYYYESGSFYISDTEYFSVDTNFDANSTPFELDSSSNIIDGTAQFIGDNNGTIQIDITSANTATVRLDADNDGIWESEETGVDISNFGWL